MPPRDTHGIEALGVGVLGLERSEYADQAMAFVLGIDLDVLQEKLTGVVDRQVYQTGGLITVHDLEPVVTGADTTGGPPLLDRQAFENSYDLAKHCVSPLCRIDFGSW